MNSDTISRKQAIDALYNVDEYNSRSVTAIKNLPSAQPDVIRCKDCKWWDKYSDTRGYCLAAKYGCWSGHWEIRIRRVYDADWYCADAERKENGH